MTSLDRLDATVFRAHLHAEFRAHAAGRVAVLKLVEVEERPSAASLELFFVRFRGPQSPSLRQGIHALEHDELGRFELFLTAIGVDNDGTLYEAVFNRFRTAVDASKPQS
jgi:hypothetical protein